MFVPSFSSSEAAEAAVLAASAASAASVEGIDAADLRAAFHRVCWVVDRYAVALIRLDAVLGDGDHGDNLSTGFWAVEELLAELPAETLLGDFLRAVGHRLVATVGGASGFLFGTVFIEAGFRAGDAAELDLLLIGDMLVAAAVGLARRGRCTVGDKTILDTLGSMAEAFAATIAAGGFGRDVQVAALRAA